jgi:hypothetical protein
MMIQIVERLRSLVGNHQPYVANKGHGRWIIRQYDSLLRRWTDNGQTFFNKRDAELRLKNTITRQR